MTYAELQTAVFELLKLAANSDNERLTTTQVKTALTEAHVWLATQVGLYRRTATIAALDDTAPHPYPLDIVSISRVTWSGSSGALTRTERHTLETSIDSAYWNADAGTPAYWYPDGDRAVGLYPPPSVSSSETISLYGTVTPWSVGASISSIERATNVVSVTTSAAHNLRVGDLVTASSTGVSGLNVALTVATVPTSTTFTAASTGSNGSAVIGYLAYTGGVLPLIADTDVPAFSADAHIALAYRAALTLGATRLQSDPHAQAILPGVTALLREVVSGLKVRAIG